jgi:hypothetical protein
MLKPCLKPQDGFDWLSAEDYLALVLTAYATACADMLPPDGEPFIDPQDGLEWANREFFYTNLRDTFAERLYALYEQRVIHKSTTACAEPAGAPQAPAVGSGSCGPCG